MHTHTHTHTHTSYKQQDTQPAPPAALTYTSCGAGGLTHCTGRCAHGSATQLTDIFSCTDKVPQHLPRLKLKRQSKVSNFEFKVSFGAEEDVLGLKGEEQMAQPCLFQVRYAGNGVNEEGAYGKVQLGWELDQTYAISIYRQTDRCTKTNKHAHTHTVARWVKLTHPTGCESLELQELCFQHH